MKVWIFQTGEPLPVDEGRARPMRAINLANKLLESGHQVTLWSARFDHLRKQFRDVDSAAKKTDDGLDVLLVPSTGYHKNIGFARLLDHLLLAINLRICLARTDELPDVAFVGYPPIETAYVLSAWLGKRNVPVVLDVKDQWPVIFVSALPDFLKPLGRVALQPYFYLARKTIRQVTAVSAMAEGFLDWALGFGNRARSDLDRVFPLTMPTGQVSEQELADAFRWWDGLGVVDDGVSRIYFVGSFSSAFDFVPVRQAAEHALRADLGIQFVLCGDGESKPELEKSMAHLGNVIFPGWIDRPKIEALAAHCIASIAPYRNSPDFVLSVPNKVIDSLSLALPLLSSLEGEVENLIREDQVGIKYSTPGQDDGEGLFDAIRQLASDPGLQSLLAENAKRCYERRFAFATVYGDLVRHLENLANR